ncbi:MULTISPECIES: DUF4222 domain-containing protein [Edwardsiella]|nr:DUF4222 domain-containing protein [Edwardsiella anguillarum]
MDILSPNRPRAQFRCRIAGGRLSYEQIVAGQGTPGNNQPRRGLVVSREAVGIAWGAFYGRGIMAKYPRVGHLYQDVYGHTVRVVATCAERQQVTYLRTEPGCGWLINAALVVFNAYFRRLA